MPTFLQISGLRNMALDFSTVAPLSPILRSNTRELIDTLELRGKEGLPGRSVGVLGGGRWVHW